MHLSGDNRGGRSEIRLTVPVDVDWGGEVGEQIYSQAFSQGV